MEVIQKICEYDGRIKYRKGEYIDTIYKRDERYNIIEKIIHKKIEYGKEIEMDGNAFYFCVFFDTDRLVGLSYDYHFSFENKFQICYYDIRHGIHRFPIYI
jgi:hypothetical protein